jgi:endonuclease/exonuclease/phosphatase family metal-dependent hydrolase
MHQSGKEKTLSIISFNAFGSPFHAYKAMTTLFSTHVYKRFFYLSDQLNKSSADIIALQEVNTYPQYFYLKYNLINFPYVYYRPYIQGPKGGIVFFSKIPFEEVKYITFEKRGRYSDNSLVARLLKRGMLIGRVKGMPVTVINTHLTHNPAHDWSKHSDIRPIHDSQLAQIIKYLHENVFGDKTVILAGDFNIPKSSELFKDFIERSKLVDVFHEYTRSTYHEEFTFKQSPLGRIDHMFVFKNNNDIKILQKEHLFEDKVILKNGKEYYLSDHIGLSAKFQVPHV